MFTYSTTIHLRDTDATGVIFFGEQFRFALEAFEHLLKAEGLNLGNILKTGDFLLPVVHAEADYLAPLRVSDEIDIHILATQIGTSSFTLGYKLYRKGGKEEVGSVSIVHVVISRTSQKSMPIPEQLLVLLKKILPIFS